MCVMTKYIMLAHTARRVNSIIHSLGILARLKLVDGPRVHLSRAKLHGVGIIKACQVPEQV